MNIYYIYLSMLLLMFILIYYGLNFAYKYAPFKIRFLSFGALIALSLRYIALLIFLISKNIKYIYFLKPLIFSNLLGLPVLVMISIYIYARNDKLKFNYCITASVMLIILYTAAILKLPVNISSIGELGYSMTFINNNLVYSAFLILNTIFLFAAITLLSFKNINLLGMWLVFLSSAVEVFEIIIRAWGMEVFPSLIIGDICFIICINYALYKLKK